ncbi:MAG: PAS domain S-box protein [Betaproteobacteria bacterium]|nr:PAS domain S-box protein [Betaproteobacteria bacterium]
MPSIRRFIGSRLVYTPLMAIVIFLVVMAIILGTLQVQERQQQEGSLFRELSLVKQRIQLRFVNNSEALQSFSRDLAQIQNDRVARDKVLAQIESFVLGNPEILQLIWLNDNEWRQWMVPPPARNNEWFDVVPQATDIDRELKKAVFLSRETNRPAYSQVISLTVPKDDPMMSERQSVFWEVISIFKDGEATGALAVMYSSQGILQYIIPPELKSQHRYSLIGKDNRVLAISSDRDTPTRSLSNETGLDFGALGPNIMLRVDTYPPPTDLTFRMLLGVVIGLSAFVVWSLWSVLKQMQVRQLTEANLRTESSFRKVLEDSMPVGIRAHDMERRITYVNRSFSEMTGWAQEELLGLKPPFPFWPAELHEELMQKMAGALEGNVKSGIEGTILRKDGTRIATRTFIAPLINDKGQQTGWVTSVIDISEPKKIREELTATQERFVTVLEGLDAAVSVVSIETGELLFANRYYRERFGDTAKGHIDLAGHEMDPSSIFHFEGDNVDALAGLPATALKQSSEIESEEIQLRGDTTHWYEVRRRYISWVDGGHLAQLLIATDITLRKNTEELARQQEERMQFTSRLTTMGEMASSLAHELNQPLSAISNYCMGIAKRLSSTQNPLSNELVPALEKASDQAHRAGTIISRIRSFVKRSEPQSKLCNIGDIVADSVGLVEFEANRHRLKIVSEIAPDIPQVKLDPVLIQQVLVNLLKNSLDSLREVYPLSSRWSAPPVKISADLETSTFPSMLRIRVTDAGAGIAESVISRMFEPFFSTKSDGMGMGLNICRSIIESHHGRLWAKNHMDTEHTRLVGCTFTILLPLESNQITKTSIGNSNEHEQSTENNPG